MKEDLEIKLEKKEKDKCNDCPFRATFDRVVMEATEDARKAQEYYLAQVKKVNETLAKYNKKIEKLDKRDK